MTVESSTKARHPLEGVAGFRTSMEAQGIEPWSEPLSSSASTCVCSALNLAPGRHGASLPDVDLQSVSLAAEEDYRSPVRFVDPMPAPRTGPGQRRCVKRASSAYAASARSELAGKSFPKGLSRTSDLGTRRCLLSTRRSRSPPCNKDNRGGEWVKLGDDRQETRSENREVRGGSSPSSRPSPAIGVASGETILIPSGAVYMTA